MTTPADKRIVERITEYLSGGGLFNPEMAIHDAVRDLLIDCRDALSSKPTTAMRIIRVDGPKNSWLQKIQK